MKNLFFGLCVLGVVLALACPMPEAETLNEASTGSVLLRFEPLSAKTIVPAASLTVSSYTATLMGPGGASLSHTVKESWLRLELAAGVWSVSVSGVNDEGVTLVEGSDSVEVLAGAATTVQLALEPKSGDGVFVLNFALPVNADPAATVQVTLSGIDGQTNLTRTIAAPWEAASWDALPSGYYSLSVVLNDGGAIRGEAEALRILSGCVTAYLADFASTPGSLSFLIGVPDLSPITPVLPTWRYWSTSSDLPLRVSLEADVSALWSLDGQALSPSSTVVAAPLALGAHKLAVTATSADNLRAGSASRALTVLAGESIGAWSWLGAFGADPEAAAALPAAAFRDLASAAVSGGYRLVAIDASLSGSVVSHLHYFDMDENGAIIAERVTPARLSGTTSSRMADRVLLSADGTAALAWKFDAAWAVWHHGENAVFIDKAALGYEADLKIRGAALAADGASVYLLLSAPTRLMAISAADNGASILWNRELPELGTNTGAALALGPDGRLLVVSTSADRLVLIDSDGLAAWLVPEQTWLEAPTDAAALPGGAFLVLCPAAGAVGRVAYTVESGLASFVCSCPGGEGLAALVDTARLALNPGNGAFAAFGARDENSTAHVVLFEADGSGQASFYNSVGLAGLSAVSGGAWCGPTRFMAVDGAERVIASFVRQ